LKTKAKLLAVDQAEGN